MVDVVAAIIINEENKILIAKRKINLKMGGLWEFPGGKVEKEETYENAIIRELKEEMDIDIKILECLGENTSDYKDNYKYKFIKLIGFKCIIINGIITLNDHEEYKWVDKDELIKYEFTPADKYFVNMLITEI